MIIVTTFTSSNLMKKLPCSVKMIILKVTMILTFIILYAKYSFYSCRYEKRKKKKKLSYVHLERS